MISANDIQNRVDEIFAKYDKDHNDNLDIDEIKWFLMEHDKLMDQVEVERKFEEIDLNGNGYVCRSELYKYLKSQEPHLHEATSVDTEPTPVLPLDHDADE